jgi:hypothetical protein
LYVNCRVLEEREEELRFRANSKGRITMLEKSIEER